MLGASASGLLASFRSQDRTEPATLLEFLAARGSIVLMTSASERRKRERRTMHHPPRTGAKELRPFLGAGTASKTDATFATFRRRTHTAGLPPQTTASSVTAIIGNNRREKMRLGPFGGFALIAAVATLTALPAAAQKQGGTLTISPRQSPNRLDP